MCLWGQCFDQQQIEITPIDSPTWQGWYDPTAGYWEHPDHQQYFQYDIRNLPDPFYQEAGNIYWLEICPFVDWLWGWKSSEDHFEDDAVWRGEPSGWQWIDLWEPPDFVQSLDLAFALMSRPEPPFKWEQLPDLEPTGLDVATWCSVCHQFPENNAPYILADDYLCTTPGPIREIRIWGSWHWDEPPMGDPGAVMFTLSIHEDIPVGPGGWSIPGALLWERDFWPGDFTWDIYAMDLYEGWFEPPDYYEEFADTMCFEYVFPLPEDELIQEGTSSDPIVYWLDVQAYPYDVFAFFGWKTSLDHWNDDAVWSGGFEPPGEWYELIYPYPHPLEGDSIDLAFSIAGGCVPPPRPDPVGFAPDMWINPPGNTSCMQDSDCHTAASTTPYCVPQEDGSYPGTCYAPTNRYISIARNPSQVANTARRITLQGGGAGPWWVGAPQVVFDPTCLQSLYVADVSNIPVYAGIDFAGDWPDDLHVKGCEIAPGGYTYLVQAIESGQDINNETCYSAALPLETAPVWGDVVSTCYFNQCLPPEGGFTQPSIDDVLAMVNRFTGVCNGPLWWFDIDPAVGPGCPEGVMTIGDLLVVVNGFTGAGYPGLGPLNCP